MSINSNIKEKIKIEIRSSIKNKLKNYNPETKNMPFHYRLLGKDRMALFSFIHSLNTTFGISIFEPVAKILAETNFVQAKTQYVIGTEISEKAQVEIQHIINELTMGKSADKQKEIERIRKVAREGKMNKIKTVKVDLFVKDINNHVYLFDIKTAKPNISSFKSFKRILLEWIAIYMAKNPNDNVDSYIAIPYNPYEPKPYERWTLKGMLDLEKELKVAEEFWDFLGGKNTYIDLLYCFEEVGLELRPELDKYFAKFK